MAALVVGLGVVALAATSSGADRGADDDLSADDPCASDPGITKPGTGASGPATAWFGAGRRTAPGDHGQRGLDVVRQFGLARAGGDPRHQDLLRRLHFSHDDPIVFPGQQGRGHAHMFWGNTGTDHVSTGTSLLTSGNSSCEGGITNRSSYWMPALFDAAGQAVLPETIFVYYKSFGVTDRSTIRPIPNGLEMLASRSVAHAGDGDFRVGANGGVDIDVRFPTCVQVDTSGRPVLSSADNVSHLSYSSGTSPSRCPASHPYRIPQLSLIVRFDVPFASGWSLASDMGQPKGSSLHADYVAAWDDGAMRQLVDCNVQARGDCGFAGGRGQLPERFVGTEGVAVYRNSVELVGGADRTPFGTSLTPMVAGMVE